MAVTATSGHEYLRSGQRLSIEHLWANAIATGGVSRRGATMSSIRDGIVIEGQCDEHIWPYCQQAAHPRPENIPATYKAAVGKLCDPNLQTLMQSLADRLPIVIGLGMTETFLLGTELPIAMKSQTEPVLGNHAVLAMGYDSTDELITIKNSWGNTWAEGGYAPMTFDYFRQQAKRMLRLEV